MPWSRRKFLWGSSALATAAALVSAPRIARANERRSSFEPGQPVGPCRLVRVLPVEQGALPFELEDPSGRRFIVEVHRRIADADAGVRGIRPAGSLDVFLRNGGTGTTPTNETHGLAAMALASHLAKREAEGQPVPELSTIAERWSSDPPPVFKRSSRLR
jgi:hypothetical protein